MIDLHSHILFGVDDGAQTIEDSVAMAQAAVDEGITVIYATPHHLTTRYENERDVVLPKVDELNAEFDRLGIDLVVKPGQELRIQGDLLEGLQEGTNITWQYELYVSRIPIKPCTSLYRTCTVRHSISRLQTNYCPSGTE